MKKIAFYLIINRFAILLLAFFLSGTKVLSNFILTFGHRWDGNSYTFIAAHGYVTTGPEKNFLVFPPLYPTLIKLISLPGINPTLSGVLISNVFFILSMILLYKLVGKVWNRKVALLTLITISIFPTTYFLSVAYPESLYIFLFMLSFYLATEKKFLLSAFIGGLAAITRPFGLVIFPAILLFMLNAKRLTIKNFLSVGLLFVLPVLPYIWINYHLFGNPLAFEILLRQNWQKSFDFPWNGIISSWKRGIYPQDSFSYKYFVGYGEAVASTLAWIAIALGIKKWKLNSPYLLYLFLGTILFTSTGFILSAPRYLLSIPPFFILLAQLLSKRRWVTLAYIPISLGFLCWFIYTFAHGQWSF